MADKILCPWCGAEMGYEWRVKGYAEPARDGWYECKSCGSKSPTVTGEDKLQAMRLATVRALHRYTPLLRPLSKQEALEKAFVYREWKNFGVDKEPILLMYLWDEYYETDMLAWQEFSEDAYELVGDAEYDKDWRCWERKPTDEERSAAEWET